jgi:hypothetical protein
LRARLKDLDPPDHGKLVLKWLQERDITGRVPWTEIAGVYPKICGDASVAPIAIAKMFHEVERLNDEIKMRVDYLKPDGKMGQMTIYRIPKPKAAKVVSIDRRQASWC